MHLSLYLVLYIGIWHPHMQTNGHFNRKIGHGVTNMVNFFFFHKDKIESSMNNSIAAQILDYMMEKSLGTLL